MEESPVINPLGGTIDYANGSRIGTQTMSLLKATVFPGTGDAIDTYAFLAFKDMQTISEILGD